VAVGLANHTLLIARDGTERPIDDSAAPIRDLEGAVQGVVLVFRDVTERRKAELALRESYQDLHRFNRLAVGRELRMIELKQEINHLCERLGEAARYSLEFDEHQESPHE
jgi:hypothetical protein